MTFQLEGLHRFEDEFLQFQSALIVPPVTDPNQIAHGIFLTEFSRAESAGVGRLMPGPDRIVPAVPAVDLGEDLAEDQDAVETVEPEAFQPGGIADRAVVGVVEQQPELMF